MLPTWMSKFFFFLIKIIKTNFLHLSKRISVVCFLYLKDFDIFFFRHPLSLERFLCSKSKSRVNTLVKLQLPLYIIMWFRSLLLFLAFTSVIAGIDDKMEDCTELINVEQLENLKEEKTAELLEAVCPMFTGFFSCAENLLQTETGMSLEDMVELAAGTEIGDAAEVMLNVRNIVVELCTEDSQLNTVFMADADCFDRLDDPMEMCESKANAAQEALSAFAENAIDTEEEAGNEGFVVDRDCMKGAYVSACVASAIHDTCGRRAFDTYNTIVKRSKFFKNVLCSAEDLEHLKTTFVESLEMEDNERDLFRLAFDLRKRRK